MNSTFNHSMWGCGEVNEYGIRSSVCGTMGYYTSWMTLPNENVEIRIKYEVLYIQNTVTWSENNTSIDSKWNESQTLESKHQSWLLPWVPAKRWSMSELTFEGCTVYSGPSLKAKDAWGRGSNSKPLTGLGLLQAHGQCKNKRKVILDLDKENLPVLNLGLVWRERCTKAKS